MSEMPDFFEVDPESAQAPPIRVHLGAKTLTVLVDTDKHRRVVETEITEVGTVYGNPLSEDEQNVQDLLAALEGLDDE